MYSIKTKNNSSIHTDLQTEKQSQHIDQTNEQAEQVIESKDSIEAKDSQSKANDD
jgi:hypothetical protein